MAPISFLLVDDEQTFIEVIAQRLRQRGYEVECAFSGRAALNRLEKGGIIDVVVLDVQMPGLDGIQTVKQIRQRHPLIEVIMLTGHASVQTAVEAIKNGGLGLPGKALRSGTISSLRPKQRRNGKKNVKPSSSTPEPNRTYRSVSEASLYPKFWITERLRHSSWPLFPRPHNTRKAGPH